MSLWETFHKSAKWHWPGCAFVSWDLHCGVRKMRESSLISTATQLKLQLNDIKSTSYFSASCQEPRKVFFHWCLEASGSWEFKWRNERRADTLELPLIMGLRLSYVTGFSQLQKEMHFNYHNWIFEKRHVQHRNVIKRIVAFDGFARAMGPETGLVARGLTFLHTESLNRSRKT